MAAITICSDFGAPQNKVWHCFHCFPIYFPWSDLTYALIIRHLFDRKEKTNIGDKKNICGKSLIPYGYKTYINILKISLYVYKPRTQVKNNIKHIRFKKNGGHRNTHWIQARKILKVLIKWKWKPRWTSGKKFTRHKKEYFKPIQRTVQYNQYSFTLVYIYRIKTFKVRNNKVLLCSTGN